MVKCLVRSHHNTYKIARGDDAENMCSGSLEPDSRYDSPCSNIFRTGRVVRDMIVGFLVVLGIAVVIAVLFVVCYFFVSNDEKKETGASFGKEEALSGRPRVEEEININVVDIIELDHGDMDDYDAELTGNSTRYNVAPEVLSEHNVAPEVLSEHEPEFQPEPESEPEPKSEPEPEPENEPEPKYDHDHVSHHHSHGSDQGEHDHSHSDHDHADHKHEHPHHHPEHSDHDDDIHHTHMPSEPMDMEPAGHQDNTSHIDQTGHLDHTGHMVHTGHMDHTKDKEHDDIMDNTGHMDHIEHMDHTGNMDHTDDTKHDDMMDNTGHMDHTGHGDQMEQNAHIPHDDHTAQGDNMTQGDNMSHTGDVHQPQEDVIIMEEHQPEFGDSPLNPAFAPSAPLYDENAAIEIVSAPTLASDIPTERTEEAPVEIEDESVILNDTIIEILPPVLEIINPGPQEEPEAPKDDLPVTDTHTQKEPMFPEEVFPPVHLPVEFQNEEPSSTILDSPAELPVTQIADIPEPDSTGSCRPRSLEMCADMPYASTMLPNWANDQNDDDLFNVSLPYFRDIIVRSNCSPRARSFTCAVLEPACVMDSAGQYTILPPCRSFCRSVGTTCAEFIISGLSLSDVFECDRFPDSTDPSVCFDMSQAPVDVPKVTPETPLPSSFGDIQDPSITNTNSGILSPDFPEAQDYPDFPPEVNENFEAAVSSVAPKNPTDIVREPSIPENEVPFILDDQISSATEESEVIVNDLPESVEPPHTGEVASQPEIVEEVSEGPLICTLDMFLCWDGSDCLDDSALCDGFQHCIDASDEYNCTTPIECAGDDFRCATTEYCVPRSWLCDGADDCRDMSDEENCDAAGFPLTAGAPLGLENLSPLGQFPPPSSIVGNSFGSDNPYPNDIDRNYRDEKALEVGGGPTENDLPSIAGLENQDRADSDLKQEKFLTNAFDAPAGSTDEAYISPSLPGPEYSLEDSSQHEFSVEQLQQFNSQGNDYEEQSPENLSDNIENKPEELSEQILDQDQFLTFTLEPFNNEPQNFNRETGLQEHATYSETKVSVNEQENINSVPTLDFEAIPELSKSLDEFENVAVLPGESVYVPSIQSENIPDDSQGFESFVEESQDVKTFSEHQQGFKSFSDNTQEFQSLPDQPFYLLGDYQDDIQPFQNEQQPEFQNIPEQIEPENNLQGINEQFDHVFNDRAEEIFTDLNETQSQDFQLSGQGGGDTSLSEPLEDGSLSSLNNENRLQDEPQEDVIDEIEEKSQIMKSSEWSILSPIEEKEMIMKDEIIPTRTNPLTRGRLTGRPNFSPRNRRPSSQQPSSTTTAPQPKEPDTVTRAPSNTRISFRDRFKNWKGNSNKLSSIINDPISSGYESRRTSNTELRLSNFRATVGGDQTPQASSTESKVVTSNLPDNKRTTSRGRFTSRGRGITRPRPLTLRRSRLSPNSQESQFLSNEEVLKSDASVDASNDKPEIKSEVSNNDEIIDNEDISVALPISVPEDVVLPASYLSSQYSVGLRRGQSILARPNQPIPLYLPYPYSDEASGKM